MGIEHIVNGLDASELNIGYTPLIPAGLEYLNFFGGAAPVGRNLAPGKAAGTVVGSPVVGSMAEGVQLVNRTAYIESGVAQTAKMSVLAVLHHDNDGESMAVTNFASAANSFTLRIQNNGSVSCSNSYKDSAGSSTLLGSTGGTHAKGSPLAISSRVDMTPGAFGVNTKITRRGVSGTSSLMPANATTELGAALRIGSTISDFAGTVAFRLLFVALWSRTLSPTELQEQYAQIKEFYQLIKGIAV